jgi:hypothetical protein
MKVLALAALLTVPPGYSSAPVYAYVREVVLARTGTFHYKPDCYEVLYCVATPPKVNIACVVHLPDDVLVMVEVEATEKAT